MRKHRAGKAPFEPYVQLTYTMLASAAYKMLTPNAQRILPHILAQWKSETGHTRLTLPARQTTWMMRREQRAAADRDLVDKGFLTLITPAGLLTAAVYSASDRWKKVSERLMQDPAIGHTITLKRATAKQDGVNIWVPNRRPGNPSQIQCGMKKTNPRGNL